MKLNGIDLFAGAGGLSEGFMQAGFKIIGSIEKNRWACETQKTRHIYHNLKQVGGLKDYWDYCQSTLSQFLIQEKRERIYQKHKGLRNEIENTIWQAEFGNPEKDKNVLSSIDIIKLLEKSVRFHESDIDFILGGPPCQAYSIIGRSRMGEAVSHDKRNFLFRYYYDIVNHFRPKFFLFENVLGILTANQGLTFKIIKEDFEKIGYNFISGIYEDPVEIRKNILLAQNFGVPQNRKRFFFMGVKKGVNLRYIEFMDESGKRNNNELITKKVIDDLPHLQVEEGEDYGMMAYPSNGSLSNYQKMMREESEGVMNHRARPLNKWYDREIYKQAIEKARRDEILKYSELSEKLKTHKNQKHFKDRFKVHWWYKIPHTIVAHISKDGHYNIHPDINQLRSITVREAARIQSFPDDFKFEGSRTAQFIQVGNAVPPLMAKVFAVRLKEMLKAECSDTNERKLVKKND